MGDIIEKFVVVNVHFFFEYLYNTGVLLLIDRMKIEMSMCKKGRVVLKHVFH